MRILTIGHGTRPLEELIACLEESEAATLVDVRRFPGSRRNPQFNQAHLASAVGDARRMRIGLPIRPSVEKAGSICVESSLPRKRKVLVIRLVEYFEAPHGPCGIWR